jgi:hypothetical protein
MPKKWIDPSTDLTGHMEQIKYPASREILSLMEQNGIRSLHTEGPGEDDIEKERVQGPIYHFNDLEFLVKAADTQKMLDLLENHGYQMIFDNGVTGQAEPIPAEWHQKYRYSLEGMVASFSKEVKWPADIWLNLMTTWQHWVLWLIDLDDWFDDTETVHAAGGLTVERPSAEKRLLWQVDKLYRFSMSRLKVDKKDVVRMRSLIRGKSLDWQKLIGLVHRYDTEFRVRRARQIAMLPVNKCATPTDVLGLITPITNIYHGLKVLNDYYSNLIPQSVLGDLGQSALPRTIAFQLIDNPDYHRRYFLADDDYVAVTPTYSIKDQIELYSQYTPQQLIEENLVTIVHSFSASEVEDADTTKEQLEAIFTPL